MPTPLPAITVPDNMPTLNAYRTGMQDRIAQDERNVLKEAGGLAAAGNYKGARSALYKGGNFGEAFKMSGEMRAIQDQATQMSNAKLEKASKSYELFGRLIPTIKTPEQLELAKGLIKRRTGMDLSGVSMEQLPMLMQQNLTIEQHLENERANRKMQADELRANQAIAQDKRDYDFKVGQATQAQDNANRTYEAGRSDAAATQGYRADALRIAEQKANAAAAKAGAPKPLTEGQRKAQSYLDVMKDANTSLVGSKEAPGPLPSEDAETPMTIGSNLVTNNLNDDLGARYRNKAQNQFYQAAEQWIIAKLRHQSGATI